MYQMDSNDPIDNMQDIIDSRDVISRIAYLEDPDSYDAGTPMTDDERFELNALRALAEQGKSVEDWSYGVALVRDSYFETYARDFAEDIGAISEDTAWPASCIDWEQAASELLIDYTTIDFDGTAYHAR